jgi:hypothetical protein
MGGDGNVVKVVVGKGDRNERLSERGRESDGIGEGGREG